MDVVGVGLPVLYSPFFNVARNDGAGATHPTPQTITRPSLMSRGTTGLGAPLVNTRGMALDPALSAASSPLVEHMT